MKAIKRMRFPEVPSECECRLCGDVFKPENWREYAFCPECRIEEGRLQLHAEIHAHKAFAAGGYDMYGSMADPNLDRGWLDGYASGVYDLLFETKKKELRSARDQQGREAGPKDGTPREPGAEE